MTRKHIVKRSGSSQAYDSKKLYASVYAACLAVRETADTAEMIAEKVEADTHKWLHNKSEVTSNDLRRAAATQLHRYNPDAAYAYLHHRVIW